MNMGKLKHKIEFGIIPTSPLHFDSTFFKPAHFPSNDMKWQPGKRWQTMVFGGEKLGMVFENAGTTRNPKVTVKVFSEKKLSNDLLENIKKEIIWRYNLDLDLSQFYQDVGNDPLLKPVIKRFYGLRPMCPGSLYEYLIIAIVLQNAPVRRSVYMMQTLFENYGTLLKFNRQKLWCFWEPKVLANASEQRLRELKMGYRAKSLIRVSQPFADGEIDEFKLRKTSAQEQEEKLISLYGIGPASVGYIMLDVFHRLGYLRYISPWEQKIYNHIFFGQDHEKKLVPVKKMLKYFNKWGRWKNLAVHYVWENIWWQRRQQHLPWLEKLIRL